MINIFISSILGTTVGFIIGIAIGFSILYRKEIRSKLWR